MTYKLTSFAYVDLDKFEQVEDMGTGEAPSSYQRMPGGGSIDNYGAVQTFAGSVARNKSMVYALSTATLLQTDLNNLKKLRGIRDQLYRVDDDANTSWVYARLTQITVRRTTDEARNIINKIQSVSLSFVCESDEWSSLVTGLWLLNDGYLLNDGLFLNGAAPTTLTTSPEDLVITITQTATEGKIPTSSIEFSITPVSAMTSLLIEDEQGGSILFTGTVDAGDTLIIDVGEETIRNDSVDAYDDGTFTRGNNSHAWLELAVGTNNITFTQNSGGNVEVSYNLMEKWIGCRSTIIG